MLDQELILYLTTHSVVVVVVLLGHPLQKSTSSTNPLQKMLKALSFQIGSRLFFK